MLSDIEVRDCKRWIVGNTVLGVPNVPGTGICSDPSPLPCHSLTLIVTILPYFSVMNAILWRIEFSVASDLDVSGFIIMNHPTLAPIEMQIDPNEASILVRPIPACTAVTESII